MIIVQSAGFENKGKHATTTQGTGAMSQQVSDLLAGLAYFLACVIVLGGMCRLGTWLHLRHWVRSGLLNGVRWHFRIVHAVLALAAGFGIATVLLAAVVSLADAMSGRSHHALSAALDAAGGFAMVSGVIAMVLIATNSALNGCLYQMAKDSVVIGDSSLTEWLARQVQNWQWLHKLHDGFRDVPHDRVLREICASDQQISLQHERESS
jgi:hypothetical protein